MKTQLTLLSALTLAGTWLLSISGCEEVQCDPTLTHPNPLDPTKEEHLIVGDDGLCHWPWYDDQVWGAPCSTTEDCGHELICLAPDLPICTRIGCDPDPKKDTVCGDGFVCFEPGGTSPTVCIPDSTSSGTGGTDGTGGSDSGLGGAGGDTGTGGTPAVVAPNVGTACSAADDPVCVGGTFCEATSLNYCTVVGCVDPGDAKDACDAAAADGYTCLTAGPGVPPTGICYHP